MSSSHGDKRSSDVEMGEATSPAPIPTSPVEAPACVADHLSFREKLVRRQAEKENVRAGAELPSSSALAVAPGHGTEGVTPRDTGTLAGSVVPDASALPAGSSTTPILVEDKGRAADSMPPPPARKEIVLALHAPSVVPVTQPKGQKRKFTKGGDRESSQQGGSSIVSGLRGKVCRSLTFLIVVYFSKRQRISKFLLVSQFVSLIDGMISECGSETSHLAGELLELQGRWSETEPMLTAVKGSHSVKVSKLEIAIGELKRDLGKKVSSLLKKKKARKAKSSEVRRLQRQIENDAGLVSRGIREAKDALSSEFQARLAKISAFLGSLECIRNMDLALATIEGGMAVVQSFQSETPPTLEAEEARLSGCKGDLAVVDGDFDLILAAREGKDAVLGGDAALGLDEATV
ncbi:BnaCnng29040D [Brassica napus]|uniref:BnaCnng29040D protein n=1 Tax=Brassica napus TaxID=3708 RepID=A0A078IYR2_BRANA|nr:BnaCnng29040D [Brassica napus]